MDAYLLLNSWLGTTKHRVRILSKTKKRYRVEALENIPLRLKTKGDVWLVPKTAVRKE